MQEDNEVIGHLGCIWEFVQCVIPPHMKGENAGCSDTELVEVGHLRLQVVLTLESNIY